MFDLVQHELKKRKNVKGAEYEERYKAFAERYETIKKGLIEINDKRLERKAKHESIGAFERENNFHF